MTCTFCLTSCWVIFVPYHSITVAFYFSTKWLTLSSLVINFSLPNDKAIRNRWNSPFLGHHLTFKWGLIVAKMKKAFLLFSVYFSREEEIRLDVSFSRIILLKFFLQHCLVVPEGNFYLCTAYVYCCTGQSNHSLQIILDSI